MHSAAWYNHRPEVMAALIAAGADLNARDPDRYEPPSGGSANDRTPLLMTVYRGGGYIGAVGQRIPSSMRGSWRRWCAPAPT